MKNSFKKLFGVLLAFLVAFTLVSCKKEDNGEKPDPKPPVVEPEPEPEPEPSIDELPVVTAEDYKTIVEFVALDVDSVATIRGVVTSLAPYNSFSIEDGTGAVAFRISGKNSESEDLEFKVGDAIVAQVKKGLFNGLIQASFEANLEVFEGNFERMDVVNLNTKELTAEGLEEFQGRTVSLTDGTVDKISIDNFGTINLTIKLGEKTIVARWDNRVTGFDNTLMKSLLKGDTVSVVEATLGWHNGPQIAIGRTSEITAVKGDRINVTFNTNGGNVIDVLEMVKGQLLTLPKAPTKEGFTFDGWYTDEALTTAFDNEAVVNANLTLYAKWEQDLVGLTTATAELDASITKNTNVSNEDFAELVGLDPEVFDVLSTERKGSPLHIALNPANNGELRMYNNAEGGNILTIRIREGYKINSFKFTLATDNVTTANIHLGSAVTPLEVNTKKGDEFSYTNLEVSELKIEVTGDKAFWIYTNFEITYYEDGEVADTVRHKVEFETNGGDLIEDKMIKHDTRVQLPKPVLEGGVFEGWFTDAEFTTAFVDTTPITADIKLYAKWYVKTDLELLAEDLAALKLDKLSYTEADTITLPVEGGNGSTITWVSSHELLIDVATGLIVMPAETTEVTLTATLVLDEEEDSKEFVITLTVLEDPVGDQFVEDFEGITLTGTSYGEGSHISNGVEWSYTDSRGDRTLDGGKALMIRVGELTATFANGLGSLSFDYVRDYTGTKARGFEVFINDVLIETIVVDPKSDVVQTFVLTNLEYTGSVALKIVASGAQKLIDNITWTNYSA